MALKGKYEQSHWAVKVIQWLGCVLVLSILAAGTMFFFEQPLSVNAMKWIQFFQSTAMFLLPPLCMAYLWSKQPLAWLSLKGYHGGKSASDNIGNAGYVGHAENAGNGKWSANSMVLAVVVMLVALPAINLLAHINQQMTLPAFLEPLEAWMKRQEETAQLLTEQFMQVTIYSGLIINLLLMALLPAVAEELTFRGVLQKLLQGTKVAEAQSCKVPHVAIWCSAILFSAIHLQFYGFLPRMLMGALFGYALAWTGSLLAPILMHFTNNAAAVVLYFISLRAGWDMKQIDAIGTNNTLWLGVVSMVITIVGIYAFRRSTTISNASSRISNGN
jgi:membrane protease YdiL (CAAX protease family)